MLQLVTSSPKFPTPPDFGDELYPTFAPAPELRNWAIETFVETGAPLVNSNHEHLEFADILFVWCSDYLKSKGKAVVGTAQLGRQSGGSGKRELLESVYRGWNAGELPDFIITICAPYVRQAAPEAICALIEHELYHCAQQLDRWGNPKYTPNRTPLFALQGHDIEEFFGVINRYGAATKELQAVQFALSHEPEILRKESTLAVCGCGAKV